MMLILLNENQPEKLKSPESMTDKNFGTLIFTAHSSTKMKFK